MVIYKKNNPLFQEGDFVSPGVLFGDNEKGALQITMQKSNYLNRDYVVNEDEILTYYAFERPSLSICKTLRNVFFLKVTYDCYDERTGVVLGNDSDFYPMDLVSFIQTVIF